MGTREHIQSHPAYGVGVGYKAITPTVGNIFGCATNKLPSPILYGCHPRKAPQQHPLTKTIFLI